MQVILKEDVPSVGKAGEVIRVAEGFGRNFLLPNKKAVEVSAGNLKVLEQQKASIEVKRSKLKQEAEALGQKMSALTVTLVKQAGEEDKIFGSVSTAEIVQSLAAQGVAIDRRLIRLKIPIRTLGEHSVSVHLHSEVVAPLKIQVVKK